MRTCDRCQARMAPGRPRVRVNSQLWCQTCTKDKSAPSGRYKPGTDIDKAAGMDRTAHFGPDELIGLSESKEFTRSDMKGFVPQDSKDRSNSTVTHLKQDHRITDQGLHDMTSAELEEMHQRHHEFEDRQRKGPMGKYMPPAHDHTRRRFDVNSMDALPYSLNSLRTVAHDSGDGETIYHCPFCGSGQVIARSDKTIECEFCHTAFTVQVQPEYSAFPQTMDGMPVQVPGMPGQIDAPVGGGPMDPAMGGDPAAMGDDPDAPAEDPGAGFDPNSPAAAENQPPWLTQATLRTEAGKALPVEDYVRHLAIKHAGPQRTAVLRTVKALREKP